MSVTKLDLTCHLSDTVGLNARECAALVNTLFDTIRSTLASGEDVKLSALATSRCMKSGHGLGGIRRTGSRSKLPPGGW